MKMRGFQTLEAVSLLVFAAFAGACTSRPPQAGAKREQFRAPAVPAMHPSTARGLDGHVSVLGKRNYPVEPHETFAIALVGTAFEHVADSGAIDLAFDARAARVIAVRVDADTWELAVPRARVDNGAGKVTGIAFASASPRSGSFPIASVVFESVTRDEVRPLALELSESAVRPFSGQGRRMRVAFD